MSPVSTLLRRIALALTALFAVGGLLFALGYAWDDPGGWRALLLTLATAVPLVGLTWLAFSRTELAWKVMLGLVVLFAAYAVVTTMFVQPADVPDIPAVALILALPVAVIGQKHALRAGLLMLGVVVVPLFEMIVRMVRDTSRPPFVDLLGGSTGAVVMPLVALAALFLVAAAVDGHHADAGGRPVQPPPRPAALH